MNLRADFEAWHKRRANDPDYIHATDKGRAWLAVSELAAGGDPQHLQRMRNDAAYRAEHFLARERQQHAAGGNLPAFHPCRCGMMAGPCSCR